MVLGNGEAFATGWDYRAGRWRVVMLGALPTARERHFAGSAHGMTTLVAAEGMTRRAPAALTGSGDASASRDLVGVWRGFSRACWLGLQTGALESGAWPGWLRH